MIVTHLKPPYYAVIFTTLTANNLEGYEETAKRMEVLAQQQEGYLGMDSARNKIGITVSYWENEAAILQWKNQIEHTEAREKGRSLWYQQYQLRICRVEREYGFIK